MENNNTQPTVFKTTTNILGAIGNFISFASSLGITSLHFQLSYKFWFVNIIFLILSTGILLYPMYNMSFRVLFKKHINQKEIVSSYEVYQDIRRKVFKRALIFSLSITITILIISLIAGNRILHCLSLMF